MFCAHLSQTHFRSVLVYVAKDLKGTHLEIAWGFSKYIWVKIWNGNNDIVVCNVHRSPYSGSSKYAKKLLELITLLNDSFKYQKVFVGNFNFPGINCKDWSIETGSAQIVLASFWIVWKKIFDWTLLISQLEVDVYRNLIFLILHNISWCWDYWRLQIF
jgi:hypothetical protein